MLLITELIYICLAPYTIEPAVEPKGIVVGSVSPSLVQFKVAPFLTTDVPLTPKVTPLSLTKKSSTLLFFHASTIVWVGELLALIVFEL
jgi:hypothetical protein